MPKKTLHRRSQLIKHGFWFIGAIIVTSLLAILIKFSYENRTQAASAQPMKEYVTDWPITNPAAVNVVANAGNQYLLLINRQEYWIKKLPDGKWNSGKSFQEGTGNGITLPATLDSFTTYVQNGQQFQTLVSGTKWIGHQTDQPWKWQGTFLTNETIGGACQQPLPTDKVDTFATYSIDGQIYGTITRNGYYWTKQLNSSVYTDCGYLLPTQQSITHHAVFDYQHNLAELIVSGQDYWLYPNKFDKQTVYQGRINHLVTDLTITFKKDKEGVEPISPYIFGSNLIHHPPFNQFNDSVNRHQLAQLIQSLGLTILRFPGGCGGDAYNWQNPGSNMSLNNYLDLVKQAKVAPYYTLNLEGNSHANLNCHGLNDHPGTLNEAMGLLAYASAKGVPIEHLELGNEPWAPSTGYRNWTETWTAPEYAVVQNEAINRIISAYPQTKITSPWKEATLDPAASASRANLSAIQAHPYVFGNPVKDNPLNQADLARSSIQSLAAATGKPIAVTEYNLFCWDGVYKEDGSLAYTISPYANTMGNGIYLAEMLSMFAEQGIKYAMTWNLVEGRKATWNCGLIKQGRTGNYQLTPSGQAFKLVRDHLLDTVVTSSPVSTLRVIASRSEKQSTILVVNPSNNSATINLSLDLSPNRPVVITSMAGKSLIDANPTLASTTQTLTNNPTPITVQPWSLTGIKFNR